ncbi:MAG: aminotransferase class V-fold PLP-dependent enzyme [Pseudomonadota bacterium]
MTRFIGTRALFIPGPTNVPDAVRRAIDLPQQDMRAPDFASFTLPIFENLKKVFRTETGTPVVFPSSGTGLWEAALTNCLSPGDRVLVARFGQFSHLWVDMAERLGFEVECIDVEWGRGIPIEQIEEALSQDRGHAIKAVLATQNETATGVASDIGELRAAMDRAAHPALLMVDGVSAVGSLEHRFDDWRIDVTVSGSQKGFMLPAGLGIGCFSEKALTAAESAWSRRCYFDVRDMVAINQTGYFPYTPPTNLLAGLKVATDMLLDEGLDAVTARHHRLAGAVRAAVAGWGLQLCAQEARWHSDTVSAVMLPEGTDGGAFIRHAYFEYGISYGAGLSKVAGKLFRIGHLGDLNETMVLQILGATELVMRDMGMAFETGSGVAAAIEHLSRPVGGGLKVAAE